MNTNSTQLIHNATFTDGTTNFYLLRRDDNFVETRDIINGVTIYTVYDASRIHNNPDILPQDTKGENGDPQLKLKTNSEGKKYKALGIIMSMTPNQVYSWNQLPKAKNSKADLPKEVKPINVLDELKAYAKQAKAEVEAAYIMLGLTIDVEKVKTVVIDKVKTRRDKIEQELKAKLDNDLTALKVAYEANVKARKELSEKTVIPSDEELLTIEEEAE